MSIFNEKCQIKIKEVQWSTNRMKESESVVTNLCLTLWDPLDCSPPGSSVHGTLQPRILKWVTIPSPGDLPDSGIESISVLCISRHVLTTTGFPQWLRWYRIWLQCRRPRFNPWVGKIAWRRNGNPLQYSWLESSMDRGAWWSIVHGVTMSRAWLRN